MEDFQHFKGNKLSRSEKIQKRVVEIILESNIPEEEHESSPIWEIKHSSGCMQLGKILAEKRGLDIELAEIICVLHDINVMVTGKYEDHARKGSLIAKKLLEESKDFSVEEIKLITDAIAHHSEKHINSNSPYDELIKDVDVLDCGLYEHAGNYYKIHKSKEMYKEYLKRIKKTRKEFGLDPKKDFRK